MSLAISSAFDSGAIEVVDASDAAAIRLRIRGDNASAFAQWFHFRISGAAGVPLVIHIENAGNCAYPDGWRDYRAVASDDRQHWWRVPDCSYDGATLTIRVTPQRQALWLAYFEPYGHDRHQACVARAQKHPAVRLERLGSSVQGRDIDALVCGHGPAVVWVIARQHPGETMAEWCAEGLVDRLLDAAEPVGRALLELATLVIVPNINPDGSVLGNLRTNAAGANLNREWREPDAQRSPEVLCVRTAMEARPPALCLDLHGDETLPYVFIDGSTMVPGCSPAQAAGEAAFLDALAAASPDFQRAHGYNADRFKDEMLTLASKWVAHRFGCVSLTLEMPFKDNANAPDPLVGWNGARSRALGAALLGPILQHVRSAVLR